MMTRSGAAQLGGVNLLKLTPRRTASWSEDGDRVVLRLEAPAHPWRVPLKWLSYKMATKKVRLDEVGSFAWRLLDGRRTVAQVAEDLRAEFGERIEPVEERLGELVRILHRGGKIAYDDGTSAEEQTDDDQ